MHALFHEGYSFQPYWGEVRQMEMPPGPYQQPFGPGFPGFPWFPGGPLERRVRQLENQVERLQREVNRLERRVNRLEGGRFM